VKKGENFSTIGNILDLACGQIHRALPPPQKKKLLCSPTAMITKKTGEFVDFD